MTDQEILTIEEVCELDPKTTAIWATNSIAEQTRLKFPKQISTAFTIPPDNIESLIVIGGGSLIDEAKAWKFDHMPHLRLVAIPSIWGSGAEASPIAVLNRDGRKVIRFDPGLLPEARAIWPELALTLSDQQARYGAGDCWAHALEGFLSPLADNALRVELADQMKDMLHQSSLKDPIWFDWSARACSGQSRSSVGLVHGIAHSLEGALRSSNMKSEWGHSCLCSLFLWPVMQFNCAGSSKWHDLLSEYGLCPESIMSVTQSFFEPLTYKETLNELKDCWMVVLKDPCSRTNSVLVRRSSLDFFLGLPQQ